MRPLSVFTNLALAAATTFTATSLLSIVVGQAIAVNCVCPSSPLPTGKDVPQSKPVEPVDSQGRQAVDEPGTEAQRQAIDELGAITVSVDSTSDPLYNDSQPREDCVPAPCPKQSP